MKNTLILGNGINRHLSKQALSWNTLIQDLWKEFTGEISPKLLELGITNIEFMEVLFHKTSKHQINRKTISNIKLKICEKFELWTEKLEEFKDKKKLIDSILNSYENIITTNYDRVLAKIGGAEFKINYDLGFTDFYPWKSYDQTNNGAKIWYIHGISNYYRSIRISFSDYQN